MPNIAAKRRVCDASNVRFVRGGRAIFASIDSIASLAFATASSASEIPAKIRFLYSIFFTHILPSFEAPMKHQYLPDGFGIFSVTDFSDEL